MALSTGTVTSLCDSVAQGLSDFNTNFVRAHLQPSPPLITASVAQVHPDAGPYPCFG